MFLEIEVFGILVILWKCHRWTKSSLQRLLISKATFMLLIM